MLNRHRIFLQPDRSKMSPVTPEKRQMEEIPNELYMQLLILGVGDDSDKLWKIIDGYYSEYGKMITGFSWRGDMKIKPVVYFRT